MNSCSSGCPLARSGQMVCIRTAQQGIRGQAQSLITIVLTVAEFQFLFLMNTMQVPLRLAQRPSGKAFSHTSFCCCVGQQVSLYIIIE